MIHIMDGIVSDDGEMRGRAGTMGPHMAYGRESPTLYRPLARRSHQRTTAVTGFEESCLLKSVTDWPSSKHLPVRKPSPFELRFVLTALPFWVPFTRLSVE